MNLRLRAFPDRGPLVWFAFSAGIAAWIVHLTLFASVVALVHRRGDFWIFHVGNAGALVLTLVATWMCWRMVRDADAHTDPDWPAESTPSGTAGTPSADPSQARACDEASCTVTTGPGRGTGRREARDAVATGGHPRRGATARARSCRAGPAK